MPRIPCPKCQRDTKAFDANSCPTCNGQGFILIRHHDDDDHHHRHDDDQIDRIGLPGGERNDGEHGHDHSNGNYEDRGGRPGGE
jgi:hypothetical protein